MKSEIENIQEYYDAVVNRIWKQIPTELIGYVIPDGEKGRKEILDMVSEYKNEHGEYDLRFPSHFERSIQGAYENGDHEDEVAEEFIHPILDLLYGSASVM